MPVALEKLEQDVLGLPQYERAFLADRLISSLGDEALGDVDVAWVEEAGRRYQEFKEGKGQPNQAAAVFAAADRLSK